MDVKKHPLYEATIADILNGIYDPVLMEKCRKVSEDEVHAQALYLVEYLKERRPNV